MHIEDLFKRLPQDTEHLVNEARRRYNLPVREAIRAETRFTLTGANFDGPSEADDASRQSVTVRVETGLPEAWKGLEIPAGAELAAGLWLIRSDLLLLRDASGTVGEFISHYADEPSIGRPD